jgi:hypothetical protein
MLNPMAGNPAVRTPSWLRSMSTLGILWNAFGVYQFANSFTPGGRLAMTTGMTGTQAQAYLSLPGWTSAVFALGALGGLAGSSALALGRRSAWPALVASFIGYALLFTGDAMHGVFDGSPGQLVTLAVVVLIAALMLLATWHARQRGLLR